MKKTKKRRSAPTAKSTIHHAPLPVDALRWRCDPDALSFRTTADVDPAIDIIGQDEAVEALKYGLVTNAPGQNIFVRGLSGTGRLSLVKRLLESIQLSCPRVKDHCYVHNFSHPERPRLISLEAGRGAAFRKRIAQLADFVRDDLRTALKSEGIMVRRRALDEAAHNSLKAIIEPLEKELETAGLTLVNVEAGPVTHTVVFPLVEGKAVPPETFEQLHTSGEITDEQYKSARDNLAKFEKRLIEVNEKTIDVRQRHGQAVAELLEKSARTVLESSVQEIVASFPEPAVKTFLCEVVDDVVGSKLPFLHNEEADFTPLYHVNLVSEHKEGERCPIIVENSPTAQNLVGTIEPDEYGGEEVVRTHMGIRAGSLLRANGGYLILEDREVLRDRHAWRALKRTLRSGRLEISLSEVTMPGFVPAIKPEPIDIHVKVVLIGDPDIYYLLDARDPEFPQLFKVLADFSDVIPRNETGVMQYASVLARIIKEEKLPDFDRSAVAELAEHGARIAGRNGKLTARFGRLADVAREAAFICETNTSEADFLAAHDHQEKAPKGQHTGPDNVVTACHVREAVTRGKRRASLPSKRFREFLEDGTIQVVMSGAVVGQVNGLAVLQAGPMIYGFPTRITATIGPGSKGVINIERESALSGAIHTKGFFILGGLLRTLLRADHPLAFEASIALEQSYGGIDGDSASGAEICCLLSALTEIPLRQGIAMTGAIDQHGHIMAIGAVNEKIEGFFDVCHDLGLTGDQAVIIPASNAGDLMLRHDVVEACAADKFRIFAVETVQQALELLTGRTAGQRNAKGDYPKNSVLGVAVERAHECWLNASPARTSRTARRSAKR